MSVTPSRMTPPVTKPFETLCRLAEEHGARVIAERKVSSDKMTSVINIGVRWGNKEHGGRVMGAHPLLAAPLTPEAQALQLLAARKNGVWDFPKEEA